MTEQTKVPPAWVDARGRTKWPSGGALVESILAQALLIGFGAAAALALIIAEWGERRGLVRAGLVRSSSSSARRVAALSPIRPAASRRPGGIASLAIGAADAAPGSDPPPGVRQAPGGFLDVDDPTDAALVRAALLEDPLYRRGQRACRVSVGACLALACAIVSAASVGFLFGWVAAGVMR